MTHPSPAPARHQFATQHPYLPGTFWLVDGTPHWIDPAGHPVRTSDGTRPPLAWWNDTQHHQVTRLQLVPA